MLCEGLRCDGFASGISGANPMTFDLTAIATLLAATVWVAREIYLIGV
jgi:hypothetical protein